jgi:predicted P-loop ATPase
MAELVGIGLKEIEAIKIQLSRTHDRSDLKYDKFATDAPRHFVFIGTNDSTYLRSKTGNRRFWPIAVTKEIKETRIAAIRDHLWGEAAYYEAQGESIELPRDLWGEAREAQQKREVVDPILERLEPFLTGRHGRVSVDTLYMMLGYTNEDIAKKNDQGLRTRIGLAMGQLGWQYQRWALRYVKPGPDGRIDMEVLVGGGYRLDEPGGPAA